MSQPTTTRITCQQTNNLPVQPGNPSRCSNVSPGEHVDSGRPLPPLTSRLVTPPISQQTTFEIYPRSLKLKRPFKGDVPTPPLRTETTISGFSEKSRSRLRFVSVNSSHLLRSQFGLSYGEHWPTDGRTFKTHLNAFLTAMRREFPFFAYLWIAEFQSRGAPHVHLFPNIEPTPANRRLIATVWCRIVNAPDHDKMLRVHDHPRNFIKWNMGNGSYLCKYLDKAAQKTIPDNFHNFGRFWGNTRGLVSSPEIITDHELSTLLPAVDETTGECHDQDAVKFIIRTLGRYHEKHHRRSWFRQTGKSTSALTGAPIFRQTLAYLLKSRQVKPQPEPF